VPGALFCDDFDNRADPQGAWDSISTFAQAELKLDTAVFVTPPHSLLVSVSATAGGNAFLQKDLSIATPHVALDLDLRTEPFDSTPAAWKGGYLNVVTIEVNGDYGGALTLAQDGYDLNVETYVNGTTARNVTVGVPPSSFTFGRWQHVRIEELLSATSGTISLSIDGAIVASATHALLATGAGVTRYGLRAGAASTSSPAVTVRFDNVRIFALP
jgi:hypothetical protein